MEGAEHYRVNELEHLKVKGGLLVGWSWEQSPCRIAVSQRVCVCVSLTHDTLGMSSSVMTTVLAVWDKEIDTVR